MTSLDIVYYIVSLISSFVPLTVAMVKILKKLVRDEIEPVKDSINQVVDLLALYVASQEDKSNGSALSSEIRRKLDEIQRKQHSR